MSSESIDWTAIYEKNAPDAAVLSVLPPELKLPALPKAVTDFVERARDPDAPAGELAKILETDAGLTVELLRFVNSAAIGLKRAAKTVQQAIALLGMAKVKNFVVTAGTQAAVKSRGSKLINQKCFWNSSLQKALFAREIADLLKADADVAFAGALLQDFLLPVLTNEFFDPYLAFVERRNELPLLLTDYEQQVLSFDHAQLAAALARRWRLPDDLACCLLFHHRGLRVLSDPVLKRTPAAAVAISALLPDQLRQCYAGLEQLILLQDKWPAFDLEGLCETVDAKHAESGLQVRNDFPLLRRCRPALETRGNELNANALSMAPA